MGKNTMATSLPRRLEENMKIVEEQIKVARHSPETDIDAEGAAVTQDTAPTESPQAQKSVLRRQEAT